METIDYTNTQLRDLLKQLGLSTSGSKTELVAKLDAAVTREKWLAMMQRKIAAENVEGLSSVNEAPPEVPEYQIRPPQNDSGFLMRELELMRREKELIQLELMRRENEMLRLTPRSDMAVRTSNVTLKSMSDYLCEFNGTEDTFPVWEKEIKKLQVMYDLDNDSIKLLIGFKVKGKAATWLHSKAEYIEMDVDSLLSEIKKMFDHRPGKLLQRRKLEERKWKVGEPHREYHHDKIILENQLSLEENELIDYMIDGILNAQLRDHARMQRFSSLEHLFDAFESIMLHSDVKKNVPVSSVKPKFGINRKGASNSIKSYNYNLEGHLADSCPKPRREKDFCFRCGKMGHQFKECPIKKESKHEDRKESKHEDSGTTALVEVSVKRDIEKTYPIHEESPDLQLKEPLTKPTRDYCVLLAKETEDQYYIEALVDSGSAINIMSESRYLNFFNNEELVQNKIETNYGVTVVYSWVYYV